MSRNDTWMPLYLGDYLADTMHLNAAQHGAYLLLLMHYWRNGPLPDDDAQLAMIAKTEGKAWRSVGPVVRSFFTPLDGRLRQKRMDAERTRADAISNGRSEAGKRGASARWHDGKPPDKPGGKPIANAMANAWQDHRQTDAPSQLQRKKDSLNEGETAEARSTAPPFAAPHDVANVVAMTRKALKIRAYPQGSMTQRNRSEQIAAIAKPTVKARHLTPEQLALVRKKVGAC